MGVAVGRPESDLAGSPGSGAASIHRFIPAEGEASGGFESEPLAVFGGELSRPGGKLAFSIAAGSGGEAPFVVLGGEMGQGLGLDTGSVYVLSLPAP